MKKKSIKTIPALMAMSFLLSACGAGDAGEAGEEIQNKAEGTEYTFEAEWSDSIEGLAGFDYSGTISGLDMIQKDYYEKNASNGYYVTGLYGEGLALEYVVNSDSHVEDALFAVRLSAEYMDIALSPSNYTISVNGNEISYNEIRLTDVPVSDRANMLEFEDYVLTANLVLEEGENVISFTTSNSTPMVGTMYATAPLVDCFKITTTAELTWNPCMNNTGQ